MKISKRKQEKINEYRDLILEFAEGDISYERATEAAIYHYTHKLPLKLRIKDMFFDHMSISQMAGNFVITERIKKEVDEGKL